MFTLIILPIVQTFNFCYGIGTNFKGMEVAIQNDEINLNDCKHFNSSGCIFDNITRQSMSCVAINYLTSLDYTLVSRKQGVFELNVFRNFYNKPIMFSCLNKQVH